MTAVVDYTCIIPSLAYNKCITWNAFSSCFVFNNCDCLCLVAHQVKMIPNVAQIPFSILIIKTLNSLLSSKNVFDFFLHSSKSSWEMAEFFPSCNLACVLFSLSLQMCLYLLMKC